MVVPQLDVHGFHGEFDLEWGASLPFPSLELVEAMLRQLDANLYAGVSLQLHPRDENEPAGPGLFVRGGPTGYFMQCQVKSVQCFTTLVRTQQLPWKRSASFRVTNRCGSRSF